MPRTQKKKADEDAKTPPSPKRRKANVAVTKRPIQSTHTTSPSPKTTPTTFPQKRHRNSAVKETETKKSSLPLTRRKDPPKLPPLHQHMTSLRPLRSTCTHVLSPDPFRPLDHTKTHDPPSHDLALLSHAAATINFSNDQENDHSYVSHSSSSKQSIGCKGSFSDGDVSKDPSYKAPESDDDGLDYSDDDNVSSNIPIPRKSNTDVVG
jgi:hypothetical protein